MEVLGYIGALAMGLSLGLIGGGGSILTVPILVYLFQVDTVLATAYSLFIVGATSIIGAISHSRLGNVRWTTALAFGIPSIIAVYTSRRLLVPALPDPLFTVGGVVVSKSLGILMLFALLMLAASFSMIRGRKDLPGTDHPHRINYPLLLIAGAMEGTLTGLVGAGGGFLIIPALVILANIPMKQAVGTSLLIIAVKSLIGFTGDLGSGAHIDWPFLFTYAAIAMVGIVVGSFLGHRISNEKLRPAFGWFVLVMGVSIIVRELSGLN
ncbi:MAG: sulfite exporter TauE/SafE family protein [Flavobacteriales bacterium]|nr:sulfite exporter TauE/SafE family protein [Flavobacteriales bacterium]